MRVGSDSRSVTVCLMARKPAARVSAVLSSLRDVADEIVVAVDHTGDEGLPATCEELADRWFLVEPGPLNRWIGWLHSVCSGDWILRLEDDEVPSRALIETLPELLREGRLTHYALPRRWLYPGPGAYIVSPPWTPDYQIRLVRNVPGLWRFPGVLHEPIAVLGERRALDLPVYHADCLLASPDERRAKRRRYESLRPHETAAGFPVNGMYTPEDYPAIETTEVPPEDAELIAAAGSEASGVEPARARRPPAAGAMPPVLRLDESDRYSSARRVPESAYRARLALVRPLGPLAPGSTSEHEVEIENLGDERWPAEHAGPPLIRLASRWLPGEEGARTAFTETVEPGRATRALLRLTAPAVAGRHLLEIDVVHEHVRWFGTGTRQLVEVG